jgi:hypothetical protein
VDGRWHDAAAVKASISSEGNPDAISGGAVSSSTLVSFSRPGVAFDPCTTVPCRRAALASGGGGLLATLHAPRYTTTEEETGEAMDDAEAAGRRRENSQHRLLAGFDGSWMRDGLGRLLIVRDLGPVAYWAVFEKVQCSGEKFLGYSRFTALHLQVYRLESYYLQDLQVQSYPESRSTCSRFTIRHPAQSFKKTKSITVNK